MIEKNTGTGSGYPSASTISRCLPCWAFSPGCTACAGASNKGPVVNTCTQCDYAGTGDYQVQKPVADKKKYYLYDSSAENGGLAQKKCIVDRCPDGFTHTYSGNNPNAVTNNGECQACNSGATVASPSYCEHCGKGKTEFCTKCDSVG